MDDKVINEAIGLVDDLKNTILYRNRYFCYEHPVLDILMSTIKKDVILKDIDLYRARIMNLPPASQYYQECLNKSRPEGPFKGYGPEHCMQPKAERAKSGRANPFLMPYLYVTRDPYTAICEVKPKLNDTVSLAKIRVMEDIKVVDLSWVGLMTNITDCDTIESCVFSIIHNEFSTVCKDVEKDYIFTQYIAEFFRHKNFEAIEFSSSLHRDGRNITIFNPNLCKPITSDIYKVDDISLSISQIS